MGNFPVIDIIFLGLIFLLILRGYFRGFVREVFAWAALVLSVWAAVLFYPAGAEFIRGNIMEEVQHIPEILAFIGIFLIVMILVKFVGGLFRSVVEGARLGGIDRVLGAGFGLVQGLTLTALLFFLLSVQPLFDPAGIMEGSLFAEILLPIIRVPIEQGIEHGMELLSFV